MSLRTTVKIPDHYLVGDERALLTTRMHPMMLWREALETLAALVVCTWVIGWLPMSLLTDAAAIAILVMLARMAWYVLLWHRTTITVSDRRLVMMTGIVVRKLFMLPFRQLTDMTLLEPIVGRVLGYGTIVVESAGQDQALSDVHHIPDPITFYQVLANVVFKGRQVDSLVSVPDTPPEELAKGERHRGEGDHAEQGDADDTMAIDLRGFTDG